MQPFWNSFLNPKILCMTFIFHTQSLSNKLLIFLYNILYCIHRLRRLFREKIYNNLESKHCYLKKYVENNNNVLTSRLLQNILLEESSVDEVYTNS
jgi:hypothetical protein